MRPVHDRKTLLSHLVYSFGGDVIDVIVDGRIRVRDGKLVTLSMDKVLEEADRRVERIKKEADE